MRSDQSLRPIQMFLIQQKPVLLWLCFILYIVLIATYIFGFWAFSIFAAQFSSLLELGGKFGTLSLGFYGLSLLPGILKRLQILPVTQVSLMLFRRQFGILMFLLAINHSGYSLLFPAIALTGALPTLFSFREVLGTIAELILFPLFITSNDYAQKTLGSWWGTVHMLTYIALLFIFGHVVLLGGELFVKFFAGVFLGAEIFSWLVYWRRKSVRMGDAAFQDKTAVQSGTEELVSQTTNTTPPPIST